MAIYHMHGSVVSRAKGHSAVAAAAYASGSRMTDPNTQEVHDYRPRAGDVLHSEIMAPADAPAWAHDRAALWEAVELAERRKDSQLCRSFTLALPHELDDAERLELLREFVQDEFVSRGMVADFSIHRGNPEHDERNHHAHILLTMRTIDADGFGPKERSWNSKASLEGWRASWAEHANDALERGGHDVRIDHRTLEAQGIDRAAGEHLGRAAYTGGDVQTINDIIHADNEELILVNRHLAATKLEIAQLGRRMQMDPNWSREGDDAERDAAFGAWQEERERAWRDEHDQGRSQRMTASAERNFMVEPDVWTDRAGMVAQQTEAMDRTPAAAERRAEKREELWQERAEAFYRERVEPEHDRAGRAEKPGAEITDRRAEYRDRDADRERIAASMERGLSRQREDIERSRDDGGREL